MNNWFEFPDIASFLRPFTDEELERQLEINKKSYQLYTYYYGKPRFRYNHKLQKWE